LPSIGVPDPAFPDLALTAAQYDALERAIVDRSRVAIRINGAELVLIPESITMKGGRELLVTQNPSSGLELLIQIDDIERLEVVR
jgi:hypothetical protein